jgi:mRNA-degrading endonuclease RelE of RelBE toxin-antitoxin system
MEMLTFVETKLFTSLLSGYLSDDEYAALQLSIAANPEAGEIVRGSGGVRKLRWSGSGRGKRGGIRVIYYLRTARGEVWMLTVYAKNEADSIAGTRTETYQGGDRCLAVGGTLDSRSCRESES